MGGYKRIYKRIYYEILRNVLGICKGERKKMYIYKKLDERDNIIEERHYKFASIRPETAHGRTSPRYYRRVILTKPIKEVVCQKET